MTAAQEDGDLPLPAIAVPAGTDHPVLAAILAELRERTGAPHEETPAPIVVAHYEDAP